MPLRFRLAAIFAVAAAAVMAAGGFLFIRQLDGGVRTSLDSAIASRASDIADDVSQPGANFQQVLDDERRTKFPVGGFGSQIISGTGDVLASFRAGRRPLATAAQIRAAKDEPRFYDAEHPGSERLVVMPASTSSGSVAVVVRADTTPAHTAVDHAKVLLLTAIGPTTLLAGLAGWLMASAALRPVERLRRQVSELSEEDLRDDLDVPGTNDEIAALAHTLNELLERVRTARRSERRFVAEAGHELRTPLAILQGELELASRPGRSDAELHEAIVIAHEETQRLARLAEDLLTLARSNDADRPMTSTQLPTADVLDVVNRACSRRGAANEIELHADLTGAPDTFRADPDRLRQAIDNLLDNALRFAPPGTAVAVDTTWENGELRFTVSDDGPGFPSAFIPRAFERFAKANPEQGRGAGLGLAIVEVVAREHNGRVWAGNRAARGAEVGFTISAPLL